MSTGGMLFIVHKHGGCCQVDPFSQSHGAAPQYVDANCFPYERNPISRQSTMSVRWLRCQTTSSLSGKDTITEIAMSSRSVTAGANYRGPWGSDGCLP
jgi:hypothetical protein